MIVTRTPFRISFFGGATDYPAWYREHGGAVIAATIDKYCYISCRTLPPFFENKHRIVYSQIECVKEIDEIRHPAVRAVMQYLDVRDGLEIHHDGDLPARSGLGSSSSFTVGLIHAIKTWRGEAVSKEQLAKMAIDVEQNQLRENVGSQDQISAAYGGLNRIDFRTDDGFSVNPVIMSPQRKADFQSHLMLFFTGLSRTASEIAKSQLDNITNLKAELRAMQSMVNDAAAVLQSPSAPLDDLGRMLDEMWRVKRSLSKKVSNPEIDALYAAGRKAGALGGKLLGAGGGGFMLFFVKPEQQRQVREQLGHLLNVTFRFESSGSRVVFYDPQLSPMQ